jgi:hypothetical protein
MFHAPKQDDGDDDKVDYQLHNHMLLSNTALAHKHNNTYTVLLP